MNVDRSWWVILSIMKGRLRLLLTLLGAVDSGVYSFVYSCHDIFEEGMSELHLTCHLYPPAVSTSLWTLVDEK